MKRTRVNVLSVINSASNITTETIDGTEHIVVKNICPLYDNCVLNGGLYPTEENDKGHLSLNEVPMPYGHPKIDGKYVSARDVRALNNHWIGAYSLNPRKEGGKVLVDMRVNRRIAEGTEQGKEVLARLDAMINGESTDPISISTGLNLNKIQANGKAPNGKAYSWIATNQQYDHIAILLNEPPAGTPEEGIGMFVNADGSESEIELVNLDASGEPDQPDSPLTYFLNQLKALFSVNTKEDEKPMKTMIVNALKAAGKETDNLTDDQLFQAYNEQLVADAKKKQEEKDKKKKEEEDKNKNPTVNTDEVPAWAKTLVEKVDTLSTQYAANNDKDLSVKRAAVKAKFKLTDIAVNAMDGAGLDELYAQTITAAPLNPGFVFDVNSKDDQWKDYDMNSNFEDGEKK